MSMLFHLQFALWWSPGLGPSAKERKDIRSKRACDDSDWFKIPSMRHWITPQGLLFRVVAFSICLKASPGFLYPWKLKRIFQAFSRACGFDRHHGFTPGWHEALSLRLYRTKLKSWYKLRHRVEIWSSVGRNARKIVAHKSCTEDHSCCGQCRCKRHRWDGIGFFWSADPESLVCRTIVDLIPSSLHNILSSGFSLHFWKTLTGLKWCSYVLI